MVIRSPAAKSDQTRWLTAVSGGVHGRSAAAGAPSTVSCVPFTVIRAPEMASTVLTWLSFLSLATSAWVTPPGTAAMTSGTTRRGTDAPAADGCWDEVSVALWLAVLDTLDAEPGTGRLSVDGTLPARLAAFARPAVPALPVLPAAA